jgi:hypothetical protein
MASRRRAPHTSVMTRHPTRLASAILALAALLVLTVPALAAKPAGDGGGAGGGGANQGTVKVVDADSGQESLTDNEPHVCAFYLHFYGAPSGEAGEWWVVDWPPTGSGAELTDGVYSVPPGGSFDTATFEFPAGHYRVVWQADDAQNEKHKTFWVDEDCWADEPEDQPTDEPADEPEDQPTDEPADEPTDEPTDEPADEPTDEPTDEPADQPTEEPTDEPADQPTDEPTDEPADQPTDEPTDEPADQPTDEPTDEPADEPADEPTDEPEGDVADSVDEVEPEVEEPVQEQEEPAADTSNDPGQPESDAAPASGGGPAVDELPDTAMPTPAAPFLPGAAATIGLLLLVVAHRMLRHRGFAPR